ncbi:hypothetical protein SprV_0602138600 [Sparganum proliferum]
MNPWRFLPWKLCLWVQLVICSLEDDQQASERYESAGSNSSSLWSVSVELVNDNTMRFDWMNLTSATDEVQHFELNAYTERDLWGVQYTKTINSTARVGYLGDLLPGRNYEIVFAAMYADQRSFVDVGMQSTPTQDPTHSNWTVDVVTVNQSTLQFEWSPPLSGMDEILHIEIKATTTIDGREANFKNVFGPTARKGFLGGLLPGRTYDTLLVVEYSNRSTEMYTGRHSTKPPSPSTVRNFRTGVLTPRSIGLMWDQPLQPDGYLDWYVLNVQYERTDGSNVEALKYIQPELTAYVIDQLPADREIRVKIQSNTKSTLSNEENLADQWSETIRVKTLVEPLNLLSVDIVPIYNNSLHFNWTNWIFAKDGLLWFELNAIDTSEESPSQYSTNVISSKRTGVLGAGLESILLTSVLPEDKRADIRSCATGILRQKRHQQTLPVEEAQGLRSLKSDHSIVVVPADKGGATFIMDKTDYVNKANIIFSDTDSYTILAEDPTKKQAAAIKKKVNELARLKVIGPDDSKFMTLSDPHIAHAYGLPKVHKTGAPLRIIVPLIVSPPTI